MEALLIKAKEDSPGIILDAQKGEYEINHRSLPEDAIAFYAPIFAWIEKHKEAFSKKSIFKIKLEYYNTTSAKQLYKLFCYLQDISVNNSVEIHWYYHPDDKDMHAAGERYSKLIQLPFTLLNY
ncbi:MAG: DUF1987 domain-containing protein [Bacteroidetes bacterium]|nr:DUF1987 domain-containing protein [Bacteroidota bacterium]MBK9672352.1 DUF1987 domain-containing protein [Bacteroidota bacterium]